MKSEHKLAIQELLNRAAYGLDVRELDMLAACFAEDAIFTMCIEGGPQVGPFEGRKGIMELMTGAMEEQTDQRRHMISNVFFDRAGDESARVVSNLTLFGTENSEIRLITTGVYHDEVVLRAGKWELLHRHLDLDLPY